MDQIGTVSSSTGYPFDTGHYGWAVHYNGDPVYQIKPCNAGAGCIISPVGQDQLEWWSGCSVGDCQTCFVAVNSQNKSDSPQWWVSVYGTDALDGDYNGSNYPYGWFIDSLANNATVYYRNLGSGKAWQRNWVAVNANQ